MGTIGVLLFLICLVFLPLGLIFPRLIQKIFRRKLSRKMIGLIFGGGLILSVFMIGSSPVKQKTENKEEAQQVQKTNYDIVLREESKTVENVSVLIKPGEANPKGIAEEVKKTCKKPCNINLYDDKKAFELQEQYDKMMQSLNTKPTDLEAWKKENYVYVADHLVGYMEFSSGYYNDYPYKDWYYKELKGEK